MASDRIKRKDIVEEKVLNIGTDYAKNLQFAIDANEEWLKSFAPIKAAALEYGNLEKQFKVAPGRKEFLQLKQKEVEIQKKTADALKAEQALLLQSEAIQNKQLQNKAKEIDIANKQLSLSQKEEAGLKRKTKLSAEERVEIQQRNQQARQLALISSSLSTAYEKESARLVLLTRSYKGAAVQYGVNSKEAIKLRIEVDALRNKLFEVDKAAGNFTKNVGNYPRSFGGAISSIKQLASAAGLLGGAFLAVQVARDAGKTIIDFDRQLIAVRKTTNFTKEETAEYAKEIVNLGLSLKGISIQGLLRSSEIAGQLGVKGSADIQKFAATIEKLKLTSDIISDESVLDFAKFIEVSDDDFENADRLGSVITELGNNFAATESQILSNTTEIQKGISIYAASAESVIGLGAATSALGNEAESSRSALQTTFKILNDGASTGKNLEKILKLTGQTAAEFREEFATNSTETFRKFVLGLSNSQKEGANLSNTLADLGIKEKRALTVVGSLSQNYNVLEDALNRANDEYKNNVALETEAELFAESLSSTIADLGDSWDALVLSIESGDGVLSKSFKAVVSGLNDIIGGIRLLNLTTDEYNKSLSNDIASDKYKEVSAAIKAAGENGQQLAIQEADKSRDRIDAITAEITTLKERNKEASKSVEGTSIYNTSNRIKAGNTIQENNKKIQDLSKSLGFYTAILNASEDAIAQTDDSQKKLNKTNEDAVVDIEEMTKKQIADQKKKNEELLKLKKQLRDNQFNLDAFYLNKEIDNQKKIVDNEKLSFGDRYAALEEQSKLELELAKRTYENKFDFEKGFSDADIEALLDGGEASKEALKKIGDEELLIIAEYQAKKAEIQRSGEDGSDSLDVERIKTEAEIAKSIKEKQLNDELALENELFNKKEGIYANVEDAVLERERRIAEIKKKYALEALDVQIAAIQELIGQTEKGTLLRAQYEEKLSDFLRERSDLNTETWIENNERQIESEFEKTQRILELSDRLAGAITDLANAILDAKIQKIDEEIQADEEKYERLLNNELLSEKEKKAIQERQEIERKKLEEKKSKELRKQAVLNKVLAIGQIGIDLARTIIAINLAAAQLDAISFGIAGTPYRAVQIPFAIGLSAVQTAAVLAATIPSYAKGTDNHPGGWAEVGEGISNGKYVPEIVKEPGKEPYLVTKPTILDLPRYTKVTPVTPTVEEYQAMMRASILSSVDIDNKKLNSFQAKVTVNNNYDKLIEEMRLTREAIKKQPKQSVYLKVAPPDINHAVWAAQNRKWHG